MGDHPDYEVERGSYWRSVENRRKAGIAAAIAIAVLGVAGTLALSATREPTRGGSGETSSTITPAEETSETSAAVPSDDDDAADETAGGPDGSGAEGGAGAVTAVPARGAIVAYRRAGKLCVSAEDGSGERALADSLAGVYTLSPDGGTIAYVEGGGGLSLVDVASGAAVTVGPATQDPPSWAPDSSWLVYTAPGPVVMLVPRSGHGAIQLFAGSMPVVSVADGAVVGAAESGGIAVWRGGSLSVVPAPGTVTGLATDGASVWCGSLAADGSASLCTGAMNGTGKRVVVAAPESTRVVTFSDLLLSPDGSQLVFAEQGDDGYSRMFAVPAGGGNATELSVRRDCYPLRWTADGASVLFVEGNAFQGEPTALMRVTPSGASRRLLVDGGGM
ncbi:MAG: hypothetical protein Q7W51_10395 [Coriobacteriia bacterium]|nr:hypothetical protein [Coriobacteriia bacterium]